MSAATSFMFSIGLTLGKDNEVVELQWDGPAFSVGLNVGARWWT